MYYMYCTCYFVLAGLLRSIGSQIVYDLDHRKPVIYVIPVEHILGKLPLAPLGDTGTIPHHLQNLFRGAPGDRKPSAGDGCRMWFVNSWAMAWSRDMYRMGGGVRPVPGTSHHFDVPVCPNFYYDIYGYYCYFVPKNKFVE